MTDPAIANFLPAKLLRSAMEEIYWGSGTYTIAHHMPNTLRRIQRSWNTFFLTVPDNIGLLFDAHIMQGRVHITFSPYGIEVLHRAGLTLDALAATAGNSAAQKDVHHRLAAVLRADASAKSVVYPLGVPGTRR